LSFQLRSLQICGAFLELHLRFQQSSSRKRETLCSGLRVNHYAGKIMMLWLISFDKGASFSDRARDLDALASNLDWSPDGDSTVPPASDGSYCSSSMQALVASDTGGAGVSWMRPRQSWCSEGVGSANKTYRHVASANIFVETAFELRSTRDDTTRVEVALSTIAS
jgi:hypothetical protein